jgi:O-antigen/teichoic acid export membrane protein
MTDDNQTTRAIRGSTAVLLFTAAGMVGKYLLLTFATKAFPQSIVGQYSQAVSLVTVVGITGILGIQVAQDRFIPIYLTNNEHGKVRSFIKWTFVFVFTVTVLLSITVYLLSDSLGSLFSGESFGATLGTFSTAIVSLAMLEITVCAYRGFDRPVYQAIFRRFGIPVLTLIIGGVLYLFGFDEAALFIAYPTAVAFLCVVVFLLFYKSIYIELPEANSFDISQVVKYSWPYTFSKLATVFLAFSDILFIGYFMADSDVAVYQIAIALSALVLLPARSFGPVYKPMCSRMVENGSNNIDQIYNIIIRISIAFSGIIVLGYMILGDGILSLMARPSYRVGHEALIILGGGNLIVLLFGPTGLTLQATDHSGEFLKASIVRLVTNAGLNVLLIPIFGLVGAAFATSFSKLIGETLIYYRIRRAVGVRVYLKQLSQLGAVLFVTGVVGFFIDQTLPFFGDAHTIVGVVLIGIVYLTLAYRFVLTKEDNELVSDLLPDQITSMLDR